MSSLGQWNTQKHPDSAERLLDREAPPEYLQEWTARIASPIDTLAPEVHTVFIFRAGVEWMALPARILDEVGERSAIHSLPHRRGGVLAGLTAVRGELLICISLETLLGLEEADHHQSNANKVPGRMVVINRGGDRLAFPATEVHGLHRYRPRELRALPATLSKAATYMTGILPWRDRMVGCLDDELLFHALQGELS